MSDVESKYMGVPLQAVIDRFEGEKAVLKLEDDQELVVAKEKLPSAMREGSSVRVYLIDDEIDRLRREDLAKSILNELLSNAS